MAQALHRRGALNRLVTDAWVSPGNPLGSIHRGLGERWRPELTGATVCAANLACLGVELRDRVRGLAGWERIIARNDWFQRFAVRALVGAARDKRQITVFAYSYAALEIFRFAQAQGWRTVLGQIDPGPQEEAIVDRLYRDHPEQHDQWRPAPQTYWQRWRMECALADRIVVNSSWSRTALEKEGVPAAKIHIIPLAYERPSEVLGFQRVFPARFSSDRPLRALFLGQINMRKGVDVLFNAIRSLDKEHVEFWFVGSVQLSLPDDISANPRIKWFGQVPRSDAARFYREADVFIFPTRSDGFGLTQLEAQAWRLPVIASRFCGDVVKNEANGLILDELSSDCLCDALRKCITEPVLLDKWAKLSVDEKKFGVDKLGEELARLPDNAHNILAL